MDERTDTSGDSFPFKSLFSPVVIQHPNAIRPSSLNWMLNIRPGLVNHKVIERRLYPFDFPLTTPFIGGNRGYLFFLFPLRSCLSSSPFLRFQRLGEEERRVNYYSLELQFFVPHPNVILGGTNNWDVKDRILDLSFIYNILSLEL